MKCLKVEEDECACTFDHLSKMDGVSFSFMVKRKDKDGKCVQERKSKKGRLVKIDWLGDQEHLKVITWWQPSLAQANCYIA